MRVVNEAHLEMPYADAHKIRAELRRRTGGEIDVSRLYAAGLMGGDRHVAGEPEAEPIQTGQEGAQAPLPAEE